MINVLEYDASFILSSLILISTKIVKSATSYDGVFSIVKNRSNFLWGHPQHINQPRLYQQSLHGHDL